MEATADSTFILQRKYIYIVSISTDSEGGRPLRACLVYRSPDTNHLHEFKFKIKFENLSPFSTNLEEIIG